MGRETTMSAWAVDRPGPVETGPLRQVVRPVPEPGLGEVLVQVKTCGVCRTDLHLAEGDLPARRPLVVPGHEVVGRVTGVGPGADRALVGERVGVPWLARTCGTCRFCVAGRENLCRDPRFTGWDRDGGYAEWVTADARYVYRLPDVFDDVAAAPLLCAGIIGYRALKRAACPPGGRLGIYGFGASAHLIAQIALARDCVVHVFTRAPAAQDLALEIGAASAGGADDPSPEPLDSAILFAPVGTLVPSALSALDAGGTVAIAGIHLTDIPPLNYEHHLFEERQLRSVTANTREDGSEFLEEAARIPLAVTTTTYPLAAADRALVDLAADRVNGAAVLVVDDT